MTEEKIIELLATIDRFEERGNNWMLVYFSCSQDLDIESLKKSFESLGLKVMTCVIDKEGFLRFTLNYREASANAIKTIDGLVRRHNRLKALDILQHNGGLKITDEEKAFFTKKEATRVAAVKYEVTAAEWALAEIKRAAEAKLRQSK